MENTEQTNGNKVQIAAKVDPAIFAAITKLAVDDERTVSNTVERLLKQSPLLQQMLEAERIAEVAA